MAAKRIVSTSMDWAKIADRVPKDQMPNFLAFRARSDGYLRKMMAFPENPPKIDWAAYKNSVPIAGMVDSFQKQYESFSVPYPKDNVSAEIDIQAKLVKEDIEAFKSASAKRIAEYQAQIAHISSLIPYDEMNLEELYEAHPELGYDPNNPTVWPHGPEDQVDYEDPSETQVKGGH